MHQKVQLLNGHHISIQLYCDYLHWNSNATLAIYLNKMCIIMKHIVNMIWQVFITFASIHIHWYTYKPLI